MQFRQTPFILLVAVIMVGLSGCSQHPKTDAGAYETIGKDPRRDAEFARQENARAVTLIDAGEYDKAQAALKSALAADVMCGPAHNNLGKIYFRQKRLYLAAWEFQYAMKLMPNQAEPPNNLGLVFEAAGKLDDAAESYGKAIALEPENVAAMGNLARARVRRGDRDESVRGLLQKLIERDDRADWLAWERLTLARLTARSAEQ
jgi:Tfp pilus assembly protein PilF